MIFKEVVFEAINVKKLYKAQMNGLNDKFITEFNLITVSSLFKREAREDGFRKNLYNHIWKAQRFFLKD